MSIFNSYLAQVDPRERSELERLRRIVKEVVPEAEEVISYGMPGFKYKGKYLLGFAAFKDHMSIFPTSGPVDALRDKLAGFRLAKGTIQFTLDRPIPESLLTEIVLSRLKSIDEG